MWFINSSKNKLNSKISWFFNLELNTPLVVQPRLYIYIVGLRSDCTKLLHQITVIWKIKLTGYLKSGHTDQRQWEEVTFDDYSKPTNTG